MQRRCHFMQGRELLRALPHPKTRLLRQGGGRPELVGLHKVLSGMSAFPSRPGSPSPSRQHTESIPGQPASGYLVNIGWSKYTVTVPLALMVKCSTNFMIQVAELLVGPVPWPTS